MVLTDPPHIILGILSWLYAQGAFYAACLGRNADWLAKTGKKASLKTSLELVRAGFMGWRLPSGQGFLSLYQMKPLMVGNFKIGVLRC